MPIQTLLTLLAVVIALAAVTVASLLFFNGPNLPLAAISIAALCATVAVYRMRKT